MRLCKSGAASERQLAWERGEQGRRLLPCSKAMRRSFMVSTNPCCGLVLMARYDGAWHLQAADSHLYTAAAQLLPYYTCAYVTLPGSAQGKEQPAAC